MTSTDTAAEARETVYAAIELSKKTWVLGIAPPDRDRPSIYRVSGGNIAELVSRLRVASGITVGSWSVTKPGMTVSGWPGHWRRSASSAVFWILLASRSIAAPAASRLIASMFWRSCVP